MTDSKDKARVTEFSMGYRSPGFGANDFNMDDMSDMAGPQQGWKSGLMEVAFRARVDVDGAVYELSGRFPVDLSLDHRQIFQLYFCTVRAASGRVIDRNMRPFSAAVSAAWNDAIWPRLDHRHLEHKLANEGF